MRRRLTSSTTVAMMAHFLLFWSLSLLRYHSVLSFTSPTGIHQRVSHVTRRRIPSRNVWFHVTSNDNVDAGGAPFEGDEDDEDQEDYGGKYPAESKKQDDDEDDDDDDSETTAATWTALDETQRLIQQQQKQIDKLMELVQHQPQQSPPPPQTSSQSLQQDAAHQFNQFSEIPPATVLPQASSSSDTTTSDTAAAAVGAAASAAVAPLKAMLFIDGTWLYYSIHERSEFKCPIVKAYGRGWQTRYQFDWTALIQVIAQQLQEQHLWNSRQTVEITRASVYTSCKKDTSIYSNRIKMFEEMKRNNYDVFMMETVGPGEKCVDIQLAVEMLHYATVANAYDVAILLRYCTNAVCCTISCGYVNVVYLYILVLMCL